MPPANKPVSHLTCPLPLCHCITAWDFPTVASLSHRISQSFALSPATKPVSHLPCPLAPNQSVICLAPCHLTSQSFDLPSTTTSPSHCMRFPTTASPCHYVTACDFLPQNHCITALPHHHVTAWNFPTTASLHHCMRFSTTMSPHHHVSQSFALSPPQPIRSSAFSNLINIYHPVTASPCHCIIVSPFHCITVPLCHSVRFFPPHWNVDWLIVPATANQIISI